MANRLYKIRQFINGRNRNDEPFLNYSLTVPSQIVEMIPDDIQFTVELTEDGILYRPETVESKPQEIPSWAKNGAKAEPAKQPNGKSGSSKRKRPSRAKS
jgi:hypothetical protein